jgi:thiol-disulfide isomerase/thioredoxin
MVNSHHGEILVVDFWATWCEPCREEMPQLGKLQQASGNFRLVTVSCDEPEQSAAAVAALKAAGLSGPSYRKDTDDDGHFIHSVSPAWSGALPALFLYDRNGRLTRSFIGETDMREVQTAIGQLR